MKRKIPEEMKSILKEVKENLKEIYGKSLKGIILYGSYARGEADEGSDIDLVILLENMDDPCTEIDKFSEGIGQIDLKYDTLISIIPINERDFKVRRLPLILNVKKEGIPI
jgi:predicted nucleotidyltransferase